MKTCLCLDEFVSKCKMGRKTCTVIQLCDNVFLGSLQWGEFFVALAKMLLINKLLQ